MSEGADGPKREWTLLHGRPERIQLALFILSFAFAAVFCVGLFAERWPVAVAAAAGAVLCGTVGAIRDFRRAFPPSKGWIGTDGIRWVDHMGERYIAFSDVANVVDATRLYYKPGAGAVAVRIQLEDGRKVRLASREPELVQAIWGALTEYRARSAEEALPTLARAERSTEDWARDLRKLASVKDYREAPPDPEALARIAEDPHSPADQRVGAALALGATADAARKVRVRVAAERTADRTLSEAMEHALEGELTDADVERLADR